MTFLMMVEQWIDGIYDLNLSIDTIDLHNYLVIEECLRIEG